jgi:triosephosphate isomerase (TIM)
MPRKLAAGNWKMNGTTAALNEARALAAACPDPGVSVLICPPATLLSRLSDILAAGPIATGGQDCHGAASGAHTGDISAAMLADAGAGHVILGHSERRADHGESDSAVRIKTEAAIAAGLIAIVCVGETGEQRDAGDTLTVIQGQLAGSLPDAITPATLVVAYEPVWAIGTGRVPTLDQIGEVHAMIRASLRTRYGAETGDEITLLYGGSVKGTNAPEIFAVRHVNGALVGGASLRADDFLPIIQALEAS